MNTESLHKPYSRLNSEQIYETMELPEWTIQENIRNTSITK